ncbi:MAG: histidine phosphatase family protein [Oscillospiraceae bacterium]|nr:histidine phosphatase family protein [Oscillospiraceae bacterium]
MTEVYFVRHAQSDHSVWDNRTRPLTEDGLRDSKAVTWALEDKGIDYLMSSPYKRSMDTIGDLSKTLGLLIHTDEDFRERNTGNLHGEDVFQYAEKQLADFGYKSEDGESLCEVQTRNIRALNRVLSEHNGEKIVIATHGMALSTILNYYYPKFDFACFMKIVDFMPFVIRLDFDGEKCVNSQVELVIRKDYKAS